MPTGILALGSYIPETEIDNVTVARWADTGPDWIATRTGILTRRYAPPEAPTSELGLLAVEDLLRRYPGALADVDAIVVATSTPDQPQPSTAAIVQSQLDIGPVMTFDVNSVCSGFLTALMLADGLIASGAARNVLVIAADKYSTIMDRADRRTVALFGDASGAAVVGSVPDGYGLHAARMLTHGEHWHYVQVKGGGSRQPLDVAGLATGADRFRMDGPAVKQYALRYVPEIARLVLAQARLDASEVSRWLMHQGNPNMLRDLAAALGVDPTRVPMTAPWCGNTGAASVAITLAEEHKERPFSDGDLLGLFVIGGGMTVGGALLRWHDPTTWNGAAA